jgi:hypothetical protein
VFLTGVDKLEAYLTKELREDSIHWSCEELGFYGRKEMLLYLMVPRLGLSRCFSLHVKKLFSGGLQASKPACSFGWWLVAGAALF